MSLVSEYIAKHLVMTSWGEYDGVREPDIGQLGALKALIDTELAQRMVEIINTNANASTDGG